MESESQTYKGNCRTAKYTYIALGDARQENTNTNALKWTLTVKTTQQRMKKALISLIKDTLLRVAVA